MFETKNVKEIKMLNQNVGLLALRGRILARSDTEINDAWDELLKQGSKSLIIDFSYRLFE